MTTQSPSNLALLGALSAAIASFCFSINDMAIKFLSGGYALHQVVLTRTVIGMAFLFLFIVPFAGGFAALRTRRIGAHLLRGFFVVFSNMAFFLGIAALPLAEGVAIFFVAPLIITIFSVIFLREKVGPRRWFAVVLGLCGVGVMLRPGSEAFQLAALLPIASAFGYAGLHIMTRHIGKTESAVALAFYIQVTFIIVSTVIGLTVGDGRFAGSGDPSLEFLFRAWVMPPARDWAILTLVGLSSAIGGYLIGQAYKMSEAALVAPFEYLSLVMAVVWGLLVFGERPDLTALAGIALILFSGLYMIWRESQARRGGAVAATRYRR